MKKKRVLTGLKPTGTPHLGNYLGMLKPSLELAYREGFESFYFLADLHALNTVQDRSLMRRYCLEAAAAWLALGLDPERTCLFCDSDVPQISQISAILAPFCPKSVLNMAHAYKAAVAKNKEAGADIADQDEGVSIGLYNYPLLMAADIVALDTDLVPVGRDQQQHLEITRDIVRRFSLRFEGALKAPEALIDERVATIPGLDGRKMSKSYDNVIPLFEEPSRLRKMINRIVTDSTPPEQPKDPSQSVLFDLYQGFATKEEIEQMRCCYREGIGWGEVKKELFSVVARELSEPYERYKQLMASPERIEEILHEGGKKAKAVAAEVYRRICDALGLL